MMEKKRIEEASRNVRQYVTDGLLKTGDNEAKKLVPFFMDQAERSLRTAAVIFELSTDTAAKDAMRLEKGFESHLWVIGKGQKTNGFYSRIRFRFMWSPQASNS